MQKKTGRSFKNMSEFASTIGLSRSTVSLALSESPRISPATRRRVQRLAAELGYRPNPAARGLVRKENRTIGLVFAAPFQAELTGAFAQYHELLMCIGHELEQRGRPLMFATPHTALQPEAPDPLLPVVIKEAHAAGLIVVWHMWPQLRDEIRRVRLPCVTVDAPPWEGLAAVYADEAKGVELAVDHLCELGHRRIAYLCIAADVGFRTDERPKGYFRALTRHGLSPLPGWDAHDQWQHVLSNLMASASPPSAVICYDDFVAMDVVRWLAEQGLQVPRDISVVSLEDLTLGGHCMPTLTRVTKPYAEMAAKAVVMLTQQLVGEGQPDAQVRFDPTLIVGQSTAPYRPPV